MSAIWAVRLAAAARPSAMLGPGWNSGLRRRSSTMRRRAVQRNGAKGIGLGAEQHAELGAADAGGMRQDGVEHRRKVAGRARDQRQHLDGRGLLLARLGELALARGELLLQAGRGGAGAAGARRRLGRGGTDAAARARRFDFLRDTLRAKITSSARSIAPGRSSRAEVAAIVAHNTSQRARCEAAVYVVPQMETGRALRKTTQHQRREPAVRSGRGRQAHREDRALARLAGHGHVAAHHARELAGDGEAQARCRRSAARSRPRPG